MIVTLIALLGQAAAVAPAAPKPPSTNSKIVCVSEPVIGSRIAGHKICRIAGHKICRTAGEWERDRREGQADVERAQRLAKLPGQ